MHTHQGTNGTIFHFNSDFSGDIKVVRAKSTVEDIGHDLCSVNINGEDLLELVLECYINTHLVSIMEDLSYREVRDMLRRLLGL